MEGVLRRFTAVFRGYSREAYRTSIAADCLDYSWKDMEVASMVDGERTNFLHRPVLVNEVLDYLNLAPGKIVVDATIGGAGHAVGIMERVLPGGRLIGIDRDRDALRIAEIRLKKYKGAFKLIHGNFKTLGLLLKNLGVHSIDGLLFDLGLSGYQLSNPGRGFSFKLDGPLDMRMDRTQVLTASALVNHLDKEALINILKKYSQERFARKIAERIVLSRKRNSIQTTGELAKIVAAAVPPEFRWRRIHPATRTFQALRIAVNNELENLAFALDNTSFLLSPGARVAIISFHSLEDRIAKEKLRQFSKENSLKIVTKKPIVPSESEISLNPRARSAKLRIAERL